MIWYCVRAADLRFEDSQAKFIEALASEGLPIVFVLTQVHRRDGEIHPSAIELADSILARRLPLAPDNRVFFTMALPDTWGGWEAFGLQELLDATFRVAPEGVANALTAAQKIDLARKAARARLYVKGAALSAAADRRDADPVLRRGLAGPDPDRPDGQDRRDLRLGREEGDARHDGRRGLRRRRRDDAGRYIVTNLLKFVPGANIAAGHDPRGRRQRADVRRRRGLDRGLHAAAQARAGSRGSTAGRGAARTLPARVQGPRGYFTRFLRKSVISFPRCSRRAGGGAPILHPRQLALELAPGRDAFGVELRTDRAAGLGLVRAVAEAALGGELVHVGEALPGAVPEPCDPDPGRVDQVGAAREREQLAGDGGVTPAPVGRAHLARGLALLTEQRVDERRLPGPGGAEQDRGRARA